MFRIAALNSSLSGSEAEGQEDAVGKGNSGPSREVLESTAHSSHSAAIQHMALSEDDKAEEYFLAVLANPYVANASPSSATEKSKSNHLSPELSLKYSCYKNLANIHMNRKSYQAASDYFLQAMELDTSEVGVCYRLGLVATQLRDFDLALVAFQEGLKTSPHHLICLDQLLSVLLVLGMHVEVLAVAITVLRRYPDHTKARAFTDYILKNLPHCGSTVRHLYHHSEVLFEKGVEYDKDAGEKYIARCLALRPPILSPREETRPVPMAQPLAAKLEGLSWQHLGRSLMTTLELLEDQDPVMLTAPISLETSLREFEESQNARKMLEKSKKDTADAACKSAEKSARSSRDSESTSDAEKSQCSTSKNLSKPKIPSRRWTTIEAGNGQDTFRMDDRSSTDESSCPPVKSLPQPDDALAAVIEAQAVSEVAKVSSCSEKCSTPYDSELGSDCKTELITGEDSIDFKALAERGTAATNVESSSPVLHSKQTYASDVPHIKGDSEENTNVSKNYFKVLRSPNSIEHSLHDGKRVEVKIFSDFEVSEAIETEMHVDKETGQHPIGSAKSKRKLEDADESDIVSCKKPRTGSTEEEFSSESVISSAGRRTSIEADDATIFKEPTKRAVVRKSSCESDESQCRNGNEDDASSSLKDGRRRSTESSEMTGEDLDTENTDSSGSEGEDEEEDLGSGTQVSDEDVEEEEEEMLNDDIVDDEEDESQIGERERESGEEMDADVDGDEPGVELDEGHPEIRDSENDENDVEDEELDDSAMEEDGHSQTQDPEDLEADLECNEGDRNEDILPSDEPCDIQLLNSQIHAVCREADDAHNIDEAAAHEEEADGRSQCSDDRADRFEEDEEAHDHASEDRDKSDDGFVDDGGHEVEEGSETEKNVEVVDGATSQLAQLTGKNESSVATGSQREAESSPERFKIEGNTDKSTNAGTGNDEVKVVIEAASDADDLQLASPPRTENDQTKVPKFEEPQKIAPQKPEQTDDLVKKEPCSAVKNENNKVSVESKNELDSDNQNEIEHFREPLKKDLSNYEDGSSNPKENGLTNDDENNKIETQLSQSDPECDTGKEQTTPNATDNENDGGQEHETLKKASPNKDDASEPHPTAPSEAPVKARGVDGDETEPPESATDLDDDVDQRNVSDPPTPRGRGRPCRKRRALMNNVLQSPVVGRPQRKSGPRRGKRGLERELQQLDYWGRKADGGASKRRRRTGQDGITTAHLLRSFVPAALLGTNAEAQSEASDPSLVDGIAAAAPAGTSCVTAAGVKASCAGDVCVPSFPASTEPITSVISGGGASAKSPRTSIQTSSNAGETRATSAVAGNRQEKSDTVNNVPTGVPGTSSASGAQEEQALNVPEEEKVRKFLLEHCKNHGVLELLGKFLRALVNSNSSQRPWSSANARTYLALYPKHRETIELQSPLNMSSDLVPALEQHCVLALAYWELSFSAASKTPVPQRFRDEDLMQLSLLLTRPDVVALIGMYKQRFSWLMGQVELLTGRPDVAALHLGQVVDECEDLSISELCCHRVEDDLVKVTLVRVRTLLKSLLRRQLVRQVEEQFAQQHYDVVIEVVSGELADDASFVDARQRSSHCTMLMSALVATVDYKGVLEWGSLVLQRELTKSKAEGALVGITPDEGDDEDVERGFDFKLLDLVLKSMEEAMSSLRDDVSGVSKCALVRLVEGLIGVLVLQLEQVYDCSSCVPWLLLHKLLLHQEQQSATPRPLPSTLLLVTAHDEVSKLERCCCDGGRLLLYSLPVLLEELQHEMPAAACTSLLQARDQATHCLYHLPSRRNKRGVRDHASEGIPLTLQQAQRLYPFYRPTELPQFQSATPPSLSEDTAALFRRFIDLLPVDQNLEDKVTEINKYMSGQIEELNLSNPDCAHPLPDVFYLLGDHFFKNKEWDSAVLYYKQDLVFSPARLDSWAGVSLALKTQLETQLNSCDIIADEEAFLRQVEATSRGFEQALKQDLNHSNLWVEFGGLVYMTFSHASRLLKQELNPDMSLEMYDLLEKTKVKMLAKAEQCFNKALQLSLAEEEPDEERWLYYYMLGKIGEKKSSPSREVIELYIAAANELHLNAAQYPTKISYNNPEEYAVEALEMFFRVHSYIIKYLELKDSKALTSDIMEYFVSVTEELSKGNFVTISQYNSKDAPFLSSVNGRSSPSPLMIQTVAFAQSLVSEMVENAFNEVQSKNQQHEAQKDDKKNVDGTSQNAGAGSDDEIMVLEETKEQKQRKIVVSRCLDAFKLCLTRFPHHYKSLYRLAHYYHSTKLNKDNNKTRNYLIGCYFWQRVEYMPVNGLFHERKISYQQPRSCNLFHGVWRIPNDEIDRPGSFAAHMYRCVSLALDVLPTVRDFQTTFDIALALKVTPEKDKKYLRENERQLLCEHATQVGLQAVKDKFRILFKTNAVIHRNRKMAFLSDLYGCHRYLSRHLGAIESTVSSLLGQTYAALETVSGDPSTFVRQAEAYCQAHKMAGHASRRSVQQRNNALPPRVKRPTNALLLHQQQQMLKPCVVDPVKTADNIAGSIPTQHSSQSVQEQSIAKNQVNFTSKEHSLQPLSTANSAPTARGGTSVSIQSSSSCNLPSTMSSSSSMPTQGATPPVVTSSTEQTSVSRPSANSHPRSLATPQPRSNAAPVPRSSATPVPRSSASPFPRRQSNSNGRKVLATQPSSKEAFSSTQGRPSTSSNIKNVSSTSPTHVVPGTSTKTSLGKGSTNVRALGGTDEELIHRAYSIYENLIQSQTRLNAKGIDAKTYSLYRSQMDNYQAQLLQYLKVPVVSQYFQQSLQKMQNTAAKLPAPPAPSKCTAQQASAAVSQSSISCKPAQTPSQTGVSNEIIVEKCVRKNALASNKQAPNRVGGQLPASISTTNLSRSVSVTSPSRDNNRSVPQKRSLAVPSNNASKALPCLPKGLSVTVSPSKEAVPSRLIPASNKSISLNPIRPASLGSKASGGPASIQQKQTGNCVQLNPQQLMELAYGSSSASGFASSASLSRTPNKSVTVASKSLQPIKKPVTAKPKSLTVAEKLQRLRAQQASASQTPKLKDPLEQCSSQGEEDIITLD